MKAKNVTEEAVAGLSAGIIGTILGYPLDVVKTRMQTSTSSSSSTTGSTIQKNKGSKIGIVSTSIHIIRTESISSLYKGVGPSLVSLSILNTITFSLYSILREQYNGQQHGWDITNGIAGCTIGPINSIISTTENLLKTQMQIDIASNTKQYTNSYNCLQQLIQYQYNQFQQQQQQQQNVQRSKQSSKNQHRTRHFFIPTILYTGHAINTIRESTFLFTYFYMYEGLRKQIHDGFEHLNVSSSSSLSTNNKSTSTDNNNYTTMNNNNNSKSTLKYAIPIAGGISGAVAWFISFPFDLIRAQIQGQNLMGGGGTTTTQSNSSSILPILKKLIQTHGIIGLYSGVTPSIIRAFLVSGSRFSAYEISLYILRGGRDV